MIQEKNTEERLRRIEELLLNQKAVFTLSDLAIYTGLSKSHIYKLTSQSIIPHYKPGGKFIFFDRSEVDKWLKQNPVRPVDSDKVEEKASTYIATSTMRRKQND